ncbi:unnamed protein product [Schistosoma mattheei]|uniref:Uncharacterized protein n=1 Tax=Schistosoma mattheei TaxID=31246 RepID=A0A3P8H0D5_9TREM|nr:unnamed protein product [Schistosoma mattheei]
MVDFVQIIVNYIQSNQLVNGYDYVIIQILVLKKLDFKLFIILVN